MQGLAPRLVCILPLAVLLPPPPAATEMVLPDGDIGCLYEAGQKHPYEKIVSARFSLDWLTGGKEKSDDL